MNNHLDKIVDTRKIYVILLILSVLGLIVTLFGNLWSISLKFVILIVLLISFKSYLYLYGVIRYIRWKKKII